MSTPLFVATLVLLSLGLAYVLTGAVLASAPIALLRSSRSWREIGLHTGAFGALLFGVRPVRAVADWAAWSARVDLVVHHAAGDRRS